MKTTFIVKLHCSSQTTQNIDSIVIAHINTLISRIVDKQYALTGNYQDEGFTDGEFCVTCQFDLEHYAHEALILMALEMGLNALLSPHHIQFTLTEVDIA